MICDLKLALDIFELLMISKIKGFRCFDGSFLRAPKAFMFFLKGPFVKKSFGNPVLEANYITKIS